MECAGLYAGEFKTVMKAYKAMQNYFNNQYFGNVKVLKQAFYDACANGVC